MEERLAACEEALVEQRARTAELYALLSELREENAALRDCLEGAGVLSASSVQDALQQRAAKRNISFVREAIDTPAVASAVAKLAGIESTGSLAATCGTVSKGLGAAIEALAQAQDAVLPRVIVVGGADGSDDSFSTLTSVEAYNPLAGTWTTLPPMPQPRTRCAAVATRSHLYIIGGYGKLTDEPTAQNMPITVFQRFDPEANAWEELPGMGMLPMTQIPTAAVGVDRRDGTYSSESFYVISGRHCDMVERFDPTAGAWEALPQRSQMAKGAGCCAVVMDSKLYVTGGLELRNVQGVAQVASTQVDCWDPATGLWSATAPMKVSRIQVAAAAVGGLLYVVGGRSVDQSEPLAAMEAYDPKSGEWLEKPDMPTARAFCCAVAALGSLLVIGGRAGGARLNVVEVYDPESCSWAALPPMPTPRSGCAAAAVPF